MSLNNEEKEYLITLLQKDRDDARKDIDAGAPLARIDYNIVASILNKIDK